MQDRLCDTYRFPADSLLDLSFLTFPYVRRKVTLPTEKQADNL